MAEAKKKHGNTALDQHALALLRRIEAVLATMGIGQADPGPRAEDVADDRRPNES